MQDYFERNYMSVFSGNQIPLYVQLTEVMRQRIIKGKWEAGTKVPSIDTVSYTHLTLPTN